MILEFIYVLVGIILIVTGGYAFFDKSNPKRLTSSAFWFLLGVIFVFGPYIPSAIVGGVLLLLGGLTISKSVVMGKQEEASEEYREKKSQMIGNKIFIPTLVLGILAFLIAQYTPLGGLVGLGIASLVALGLSMYYTKEQMKYIPADSSRLLQQMGPAVILPQLLGALGALFSKAGVGEKISSLMAGVVPEGNALAGVILYCVSMAVFTMIMGNAFAAFAVITAGIGIPFVIGLGGDPVIVGALGLTAGYCGTLMTPMAANFNIVPAMIMEMKNKNGVILEQIPIAVIMLITHIVLMYVLAF